MRKDFPKGILFENERKTTVGFGQFCPFGGNEKTQIKETFTTECQRRTRTADKIFFVHIN